MSKSCFICTSRSSKALFFLFTERYFLDNSSSNCESSKSLQIAISVALLALLQSKLAAQHKLVRNEKDNNTRTDATFFILIFTPQ